MKINSSAPGWSQALFTSDQDYVVMPEPEFAFGTGWRRGETPSLTDRSFRKRNLQVRSQAGTEGLMQSDIFSRGSSRVLEALACSAVIEERNRLAREIHDTLAQEFAGILLHLEAATGSDRDKRHIVSESLTRARELAKSGLEDTRRMLLGLRPKSLEDAHLSDALRQLAEGFSRDCGINCTFRASGRTQDLPQDMQDELYRVAQESLCNVRKHSRASSVSILLSHRPGVVVLTIKDNGQGFGARKQEAGAQGFGLSTMCDRAHQLGGRMDINGRPGRGAKLKVTVPLTGKPQLKGNHQ
ncbi:MAG TPA: sensor histidine kinase [Verrucomicrobiae bacterium]|nr:sensor histidine kinase [Verrucomicrobiae bacterium]